MRALYLLFPRKMFCGSHTQGHIFSKGGPWEAAAGPGFVSLALFLCSHWVCQGPVMDDVILGCCLCQVQGHPVLSMEPNHLPALNLPLLFWALISASLPVRAAWERGTSARQCVVRGQISSSLTSGAAQEPPSQDSTLPSVFQESFRSQPA